MTERFPSLEMVRFSNTGSEANTYAINTARAVTGKSKILVYDGAYHGPGYMADERRSLRYALRENYCAVW